MFLFKRRKASPENIIEPLVPEEPAEDVRPSRKNKKDEAPAGKKADDASARKKNNPGKEPQPFEEDSLQILESDDAPVKIVIPASELEQDDESDLIEEDIQTGLPAQEAEQELVDNLFEKVNENRRIQEEPDVELEALLGPEAGKPAKASDKTPSDKKEVENNTADRVKDGGTGKRTGAQLSAPGIEAPAHAQAEIVQQSQLQATGPQPAPGQPPGGQPAPGGAIFADQPLAAATTPSPATAQAPPVIPAADKAEEKSAEKDKKPEEDGNLFSKLFQGVEEKEETPLDRLIKSLPDIPMDEVLSESEEVKGLMSEWYEGTKKSWK